jgi:hypothetical protein
MLLACIFGGESRFFFHIWTTKVNPYNALNSEFANFETPCIIQGFKATSLRCIHSVETSAYMYCLLNILIIFDI